MRSAALAVAALLALATGAGGAELSVGSGAVFNLGTGSLDLGCADLTVAGTLVAGTVGFDQARDVTIDATGVIMGDSATLEVAGNWANAGTFDAGASTLQLVDGCGLTSAVISGDTSFANLAMTTTTGKLYRFTAGSTQAVTSSLALLGAAGNLLTIRSTVDGSEAFLNLQGTGSGNFVDVQDNDTTAGNPVILGPNSVIGPNTPGWLSGMVLPALGVLGLALLAFAVLGSGRRVFRRSDEGEEFRVRSRAGSSFKMSG